MVSSLNEQAYAYLRDKIVNCEFPPGSFLFETRLVSELQMSRTPIRNALVQLEQQHLIRINPKNGAVVTKIDAAQIRNVYDTRALIECYSLRNFGSQFSKDRLWTFLDACLHYSEDTMDDVFLKDNIFHFDIAQLCENDLLLDFYHSIRALNYRLTIYSGRDNKARVDNSNSEHIAIADAMLKEDYNKAADLLSDHLTNAKINAYQKYCVQIGSDPAV